MLPGLSDTRKPLPVKTPDSEFRKAIQTPVRRLLFSEQHSHAAYRECHKADIADQSERFALSDSSKTLISAPQAIGNIQLGTPAQEEARPFENERRLVHRIAIVGQFRIQMLQGNRAPAMSGHEWDTLTVDHSSSTCTLPKQKTPKRFA